MLKIKNLSILLGVIALGLIWGSGARAVTFSLGQTINAGQTYLSGLNSALKVEYSEVPLGVMSLMQKGYVVAMSRWCVNGIGSCDSAFKKAENKCVTSYNLCIKGGNSTRCANGKAVCNKSNQKKLSECKDRYIGSKSRCWLPTNEKTCLGTKKQDCMDNAGLSGTRSAISCNTATGEWNWGECVATATAVPCAGTAPSCPAGWTGSYVCKQNAIATALTYSWVDNCIPPGTDYCYRGVAYKSDGTNAWSKCVGRGYTNSAGANCLYNICPDNPAYVSFYSQDRMKAYIDAIYSNTILNSCDPSFVYTQCQNYE